MPVKVKKVKKKRTEQTEGDVVTGINTDRSLKNNGGQRIDF